MIGHREPCSTRGRSSAVLMLLLLAGCDGTGGSPLEPATGRETPGAHFDWSMPDRFGGDQDGDGLVDYRRTAEEISPASWPVNFDACDLPAGSRYAWYIDERWIATVTSCLWTYAFPAEGQYDVALHVIREREPGTWAEEVVTVQDWLIVSFGDSYASGEGVPEIPAANDELVDAVNSTLRSLDEARRNVDATRASLDEALLNLQEAFEAKGLALSILQTQQQRLNAFLAACTIESFRDLVECANFLVGLPFETYQTASAHFHQAVANAQERYNDLSQAYLAAQQAATNAQNAWQSAVNAYQSLQVVIAELSDGLGEATWQAPYPGEVWGNENCHRSANAAPARAALALEASDPRTSVTFVHFACTGARIDRHRANLIQQIPWAEALVGSREIDAVLVSIGGNDAGFASIATACVVQQACYDLTPQFNPAEANGICTLLGFIGFEQGCLDFFGTFPAESAKQLVESGVAALPAKYEQLATVVLPQLTGLLEPGAGAPSDRVRSGRVYISEYVDMTRGDAGAYCTQDPNNLLGMIPAVTPDELQWLDLHAAGSINQAVATAAAAHGWNAVTGIYAAYREHGYCADDHWVVRVYETFLRQGDGSGMAHPNLAGHLVNGQIIFQSLLPALYPQGPDGPPRAPDQTDLLAAAGSR